MVRVAVYNISAQQRTQYRTHRKEKLLGEIYTMRMDIVAVHFVFYYGDLTKVVKKQ